MNRRQLFAGAPVKDASDNFTFIGAPMCQDSAGNSYVGYRVHYRSIPSRIVDELLPLQARIV